MKRPAAIAATASLLVGAFLPLAFSNDAQAAPNCNAQLSAYKTASHQVTVAQKKAKRAKAKVRRAVAHHAPRKAKRAKRDNLHVKRVDLRYAKLVRNRAYASLATCQKGATTTQQGTAKPVPSTTTSPSASATATATTTATATATTTATATATTSTGTTFNNPLLDLIAQLQAALKGAGAPQQLLDVLQQIQDALKTVPANVDPAAYQKALTDALAAVQKAFQDALADPTKVTAATLVDAIINPLIIGLKGASVPVLPDVLKGLENTLDPILLQLGLGSLINAFPTSFPTFP